MLRITTYNWVPVFAQGYVRDLPLRWACEEMSLPYELRLITRQDKDSKEHRKLQPFGQVPVLEDGDVTIFESGAILLHLGEKSEILLPKEASKKARARTWVFAALNSIDPVVREFRAAADNADKQEWAKLRQPQALENMKNRLRELNQWLQGREFLEEQFSVGDMMMTIMLRNIEPEILAEFPEVAKLQATCEARPAFQKALAAQLKTFAEHSP
jgi:glutathione S-transferase